MTTGAHDAGGGFGRSAGANAARGIMVIVVAVIVGVLLMNRGLADDTDQVATDGVAETDDPAPVDQGDPTEAAAADDPATTSTTVTLAPPRDPSEVAVLVLNGSGTQGVAGRGTDLLKTRNYLTREPANADAVGPSVVFFQPGYESEAIAVAGVFGVDPAAVVQPFDPAASPVADIQGANIIVRIGNDGVIAV